MKKCTKCLTMKEFSEFSKHKKYKNGLRSSCKECIRLYDRKVYHKNPERREKLNLKLFQWREKNRNSYNKYTRKYRRVNKEKTKNTDLKKNYGITLEIYNKMLKEQNYCCKICNKNEKEFKLKLCVDHCHKTEKIRGLLCNKCNFGISYFSDNIEIINKAIEYLRINNG